MKRFLVWLSALALMIAGALGPIAAASEEVGVSTGVHDFVISDFQIDSYLTRDNENRSRLKTTERITAEFPDYDQNHGIERAIPKTYDGHPTTLKVESVKRADGSAWNYTTYESDDNLVVRIGDADKYVHGEQKYEITYTQRDVTRYFADNDRDEFYWDTNGTQWKVPVSSLTTRIHVGDSIAQSLTNEQACYQGFEGSSQRCDITTDGQVLTATAQNLGVGENATVAVGFQKNTFAAYQPTLRERLVAIWGVLNIVGWIAAVVAILALFARYFSVTGRRKELGTIVPEYLPPSDASVTVSSQVIGAARSVMTAQLIDLAVRHYVKIYEVKAKSWFSPAQYEIEIVRDPNDLRWEEQEILKDMFDGNVAVGARLNLKELRNNLGFTKRTTNNDSDLAKLMRNEYALHEMKPENKRWFRKLALILGVAGIIMLSFPLLFVALFAFIFSFVVYSLTDKGLALKRYLEGLKMYIGVAEQERLQMLQSPEGAEKVASVTDGNTDPAQLVKLYERVLPYAVLFGQEKNWNKQLGTYYENAGAQPDWYSGNNAVFNAAVFSSAMNNFSTSTTTYTSSSSSSSSGSGGGGSSGGGGGGGGGGGW